MPQFWAIVFYGAFFVLGALVHGQPDWIDRAHASAKWMLPAIALAYPAFLWRLAVDPPGATPSTAPWPRWLT